MRIGIVGGGILGMLAAHELINRGCHVTIIERGEIGRGQGASKDSRMIAVLPQMAAQMTLMDYAWSKWISYQEPGGIAAGLLHQAKLLELFANQSAAIEFAAILDSSSIEATLLEDKFDSAKLNFSGSFGVLRDQVLLLSVEKFLQRVLKEVVAANGVAYQRATVTGVNYCSDSVQVVVAGSEELQFDQLVVASGNWVAGMLGWFGLDEESITATAQPYYDLPRTIALQDFSYEVTPIVFDHRQHNRVVPVLGPNCLRLFNALPGEKVEPGESRQNAKQKVELLDYANELMQPQVPFVDDDLVPGNCWYVCARDFLPVVGRITSCDRVSLLIPGCGSGVRTGPGLASALVDQLLGVEPQIDLSSYAPHRFS